MSLRPQAPPTVPDETRRVARAAFPKGAPCLRIADGLGPADQTVIDRACKAARQLQRRR